MNKVWSGEFKMPYTEAVMDNIDFSIDAKGNAYLLAKVFDSDRRKEKDNETGKPLYHFEVLKFSKGKRDLTHTVVNIGDFFIQKAAIIENSLHEMVIACTYSKKQNLKLQMVFFWHYWIHRVSLISIKMGIMNFHWMK